VVTLVQPKLLKFDGGMLNYVFPLAFVFVDTEARLQLSRAVKSARDTLSDSERISGKWNKDDKVRSWLDRKEHLSSAYGPNGQMKLKTL